MLVIQEVFGVHEHIKDVCRRFAQAGYLAIAPELYARQGDASRYASVAEIFQNVVSKVPDAQVMSDLDATTRWASANGGDAGRLAITGFCVYPDAPHAFHADYRPSYRKDAAQDGWVRCLAWFRSHGAG